MFICLCQMLHWTIHIPWGSAIAHQAVEDSSFQKRHLHTPRKNVPKCSYVQFKLFCSIWQLEESSQVHCLSCLTTQCSLDTILHQLLGTPLASLPWTQTPIMPIASGLEQPHLPTKQGCQIHPLEKHWVDGRVMPIKDTLGHLQKNWPVYPSNLSKEHLTPPITHTYIHHMYFDCNTQ